MKILNGLVRGDTHPDTDVTLPLSADVLAQRAHQRRWLMAGAALYLGIATCALFLM